MFNHLKQKWGVSPKQFWVIFIAFGLTGITTAWLTKHITLWLKISDISAKWGIKLAMLFLGYQFILLFYGALLGQWSFFWKFEKKLLQRMKILAPPRIKIAILASGNGSNAEMLMKYFKDHQKIKVELMACNKVGVGVWQVAEKYNVASLLIEKSFFFNGDGYAPLFKKKNIDFLILAGFLWKIPPTLLEAFPNRIINIHPALLPKFGGKGMFGIHVHEAVIAAKEKESGITIHLVDEHYDNGATLLQEKCIVEYIDTAATLAKQVLLLEHKHFSSTVEKYILSSQVF